MDDKEILDNIALDSWYGKGANAEMIRYTAKLFSRYFTQGDFLELGPAEGILTASLQIWATSLTLVDGSKQFCGQLKNQFPSADIHHCLFEEFTSDRQFDFIILGHVLEHVDDPVRILEQLKPMLKSKGRVFAAVPNSRSLHRQAAVIMKLILQEDAMSEADLHHGHKRVYNPELFRQHFIEAGYQIEVFGGYWLKPLSDRQLEESWSSEMLQAFMQLGERYPDIAAENYIVAGCETK